MSIEKQTQTGEGGDSLSRRALEDVSIFSPPFPSVTIVFYGKTPTRTAISEFFHGRRDGRRRPALGEFLDVRIIQLDRGFPLRRSVSSSAGDKSSLVPIRSLRSFGFFLRDSTDRVRVEAEREVAEKSCPRDTENTGFFRGGDERGIVNFPPRPEEFRSFVNSFGRRWNVPGNK